MRTSLAAVAVALSLLIAVVPTQAAVIVTPAGTALGFSISTYASGGSTSNYPFIAAAPIGGGNLAVINHQFGRIDRYPDVNGQTLGTSTASTASLGFVNISNAGGITYASILNGGLYQVSSSLGLTPVATPGFAFGYGLATNPATGHLVAPTNFGAGGVYDINPITGSSTLLFNPGFVDGVSVSPDGTKIIAAVGGGIVIYNIPTNTQTFVGIGGAPDGTGVISGGPLNGYIIVANNNGTLVLVNPTTLAQTIIATGGLRFDFTSPNSNDGSLMIADFGSMYRLQVAGGTIGGPLTTPEPASVAIWGFVMTGLTVAGLRRRWLKA